MIKELQVAARSGIDADSNPRLRTALSACKSANMPKENIQKVLNKAKSGLQDNLEDIIYEGFGPGGVAIIVEALTDNRNRTASEVRSSFAKYNGNLGEKGSANYLFKNVEIIINNLKNDINVDNIISFAIDHEASDVEIVEDRVEIICEIQNLNFLKEKLKINLDYLNKLKHLGYQLIM